MLHHRVKGASVDFCLAHMILLQVLQHNLVCLARIDSQFSHLLSKGRNRFLFVASFCLLVSLRTFQFKVDFVPCTVLGVLRHLLAGVRRFTKHYVQSAVVRAINTASALTLLLQMLPYHQTGFSCSLNLNSLDVIVEEATLRRTKRLVSSVTGRHFLSSDCVLFAKYCIGQLLG